MDLPVLPGFDPAGGPSAEVAGRAARAWLAGGIVGMPTETVYGLAADAENARSVGRVYAVKGRPPDHPLIVHVAGPKALDGWSAERNEMAHRLAEEFWPGPLTLVVERSRRAGDFITGGQDTVALRCPDHPVALACLAALARESGDPARGVAAPSANRFGRVSPTRADDVVAEVGPRLDPGRDLVVDGGVCRVGVESTIVDCTADPPRVLRLGAISQAQVDEVLSRGSAEPLSPPDAVVARPVPIAEQSGATLAAGQSGATRAAAQGGGRGGPRAAEQGDGRGGPRAAGQSDRRGGPRTAEPSGVRAPGTLASHYAPRARVVLLEPGRAHDPEGFDAQEGLRSLGIMEGQAGSGGGPGLIAPAEVATPRGWIRLAAPSSDEQYARELYAALRRADERALAMVAAVLPDPSGGPLAHAVRDRLARAAHGE